MNTVNLIGRLTADVELKYNSSNIPYTKFTLAVNRNFTKDGEREADFISCVAWRKTAEIITKNFKKGSQFGAVGRIQTGSYETQDGSKRYTTDVVIEHITFVEKKKDTYEPEYAEDIIPKETPNEEHNDPFACYEENEIVIKDEDLPF